MKVKELIEELQKYDQELEVCFDDFERGYQEISEIEIEESFKIRWQEPTIQIPIILLR